MGMGVCWYHQWQQHIHLLKEMLDVPIDIGQRVLREKDESHRA
jgi:hypothetical protein